MTAGRRTVCLIACLSVAAQTELRGGESTEAMWRCPRTEDGSCIPNPRSFGFYPTRWRKWPGTKTEGEAVATPKPTTTGNVEPNQGPSTGTEELPSNQTEPRTGPGDEPPDMMPSDPTRPPVKPELPPELKSDLPQPPDLESLLPEEGPDETPPKAAPKAPPRTPTPPALPEKKPLPPDEDPFKDDDPLGGEMEGAAGPQSRPSKIATSKTNARPQTNATSADNSAAKNDPPPSGKLTSTAPLYSSHCRKTSLPAANRGKDKVPARPEPKAIPDDEDPFKDEILPGEQMEGADLPPTPPAPTTTGKVQWRPDPRLQPTQRKPAAKPPIVLADALDTREHSTRPQAITATSPARFPASHSNPLRSAASGVLLPGPVTEPDDVVPTANWSPETAAPQAAPTADAEIPSTEVHHSSPRGAACATHQRRVLFGVRIRYVLGGTNGL